MYLRAEYGIMLECEVIITYSGRFALTTGASAFVRWWEWWISAQFGGSAFIIIERSRPRRPHRHCSSAEVVISAETATEHTTRGTRVGLYQAMGRREESSAVVLREDICFEAGIPEGGRHWLSRCYLICNKYMTLK